MDGDVVYRPSPSFRTGPRLPTVTRIRAVSVKEIRSARAYYQFTSIWALVFAIGAAAVVAGAVMGWMNFAADDNVYTARFARLAQEDAITRTSLSTEQAVREAADMNIMSLHSTLGIDIVQEIATRLGQDMVLMTQLATEISQRQAAQALLNSLLGTEVSTRVSTDISTSIVLDGLEMRLNTLLAYDVFALQQFMLKMDNLTHIGERLAQEIAFRVASDMVLMAQDSAQTASLGVLASGIAAEIATRTASDMGAMAGVAQFLSQGLFTINNQTAVQNNFNIVSQIPCGVTVGSGGTNIITLANNALRFLGIIGPEPTTRNVGLYASTNMAITTNPAANTVRFDVLVVPVPSNGVEFSGAAVMLNAAVYDNNWYMDAGFAGQYIMNYPTYNGQGWEIPLNPFTNLPSGIWIVRMTQVITFFYSTDAPVANPVTSATCIGTFVQCANTPGANFPSKSYSISFAGSGVLVPQPFSNWGLNYQDAVFTSTTVIDGSLYPTAGTGVYSVWRYDGVPSAGGFPVVSAIRVLYQITRNH